MVLLYLVNTATKPTYVGRLEVSTSLRSALHGKPEIVRYLTEEGEKRAFVYGRPLPLNSYRLVHECDSDSTLAIADASRIGSEASIEGVVECLQKEIAEVLACSASDCSDPVLGEDATAMFPWLLFFAVSGDVGEDTETDYHSPPRWNVWYSHETEPSARREDDSILVDYGAALFDSDGRARPLGRQMMGEEPLDNAADVVVLDQPRWAYQLVSPNDDNSCKDDVGYGHQHDGVF